MEFVKYNSSNEMNEFKNFLYFDNTNMSPEDVSNEIIKKILEMI